MENILRTVIVDDEQDAVDFIESIAKEYCPNLKVVGRAYSAIEGIEVINKEKPDLVFLDVEMPHGSGFDLLAGFPEKDFDVIFITAFNHYAIRAIKFSAVDYILKPININELLIVLKRALEHTSLVLENKRLREELKERFSVKGIIAKSAKMQEVLNMVGRVASSKASISTLREASGLSQITPAPLKLK